MEDTQIDVANVGTRMPEGSKWGSTTPDERNVRWMCRVLADGTEYEHDRAIAYHACCDEDRPRFEAATRDNPVKSWSGRCVYWREKRVKPEPIPVQLGLEEGRAA